MLKITTDSDGQDGVISLFHFAELHEHLAHLPYAPERGRGPGVKDQPLPRHRSAATGLQNRCDETGQITRCNTGCVEPERRFELLTCALRVRCSTD